MTSLFPDFFYCTICKQEKDRDAFYLSSIRDKRHQCSECLKEKKKKRRMEAARKTPDSVATINFKNRSSFSGVRVLRLTPVKYRTGKWIYLTPTEASAVQHEPGGVGAFLMPHTDDPELQVSVFSPNDVEQLVHNLSAFARRHGRVPPPYNRVLQRILSRNDDYIVDE